MQKPKLVVLAAGGTGGHIFPAKALAEKLMQDHIGTTLITDRRGQTYAFDDSIAVKRIFASSPNKRGLGAVGKLQSYAALAIGGLQALYHLLSARPDVVVGFGGYAAAPTIIAAHLLGIPVIIHEQNAILGRTNKLFTRYANKIAISFPDTKGLTADQQKKAIFTGNPVRSEFAAIAKDPYPPVSKDGKLRLLITGGSQGTTIFSRTVPEAIALLPQALRENLHVSQQCRAEDVEDVKKFYANIKVAADIQPFFHDVAERLAASHLTIIRSGASTVAEITAAGRPSILVPFPQALDDHQTINARALADKEAGFLMPQDAFKASALAARLESYLTLPDTLIATARNARNLGVRDAAERLAQLVYQLGSGLNGNHKPVSASDSSKRAA